MGLEQPPLCGGRLLEIRITIPHGGLGTQELEYYEALKIQSPSHTVGLELYDEEEIWDYLEQLQSPSHAVGLEPL